jgi:6-phosphogluconate dehydrogenase (decarboxylating)
MKAKTEKIRVTVSREEVKEIEISFPYFTKNVSLYCKFFSNDKAIFVYDYDFNMAVNWSNGSVPGSWLLGDQITEEEFNAKFNEVMNALIDINNEKTI